MQFEKNLVNKLNNYELNNLQPKKYTVHYSILCFKMFMRFWNNCFTNTFNIKDTLFKTILI